MNEFSGSVKAKISIGMKARINPAFTEGRIHKGREFVIASVPREICGTEVVALNKLDGARFSVGYDLSMLEITEI